MFTNRKLTIRNIIIIIIITKYYYYYYYIIIITILLLQPGSFEKNKYLPYVFPPTLNEGVSGSGDAFDLKVTINCCSYGVCNCATKGGFYGEEGLNLPLQE